MAQLGDGGARWIGVTWSLAVEEQFYWFLPPLVYWLSSRSMFTIAIVSIALSPLIRTLAWVTLNWFSSYCLLPCRMDTLMWGVLVACMVRNPATKQKVYSSRHIIALIIVFLVISVLFDFYGQWADIYLSTFVEPIKMFVITLRYSAIAAIFGLMLLYILVSDSWLNRLFRLKVLRAVGLISYSVYMYHQAVNGLLHGWLLNQAPQINSWKSLEIACAGLLITLSLAVLSYYVMEQPIRRFAAKTPY
jgi:peptidoglycan/LPS O-acetylase OafA/YrhL